MSIETYSDLSSAGKILFSRFKDQTITRDDLQHVLSNGKITQEEFDFMVDSL